MMKTIEMYPKRKWEIDVICEFVNKLLPQEDVPHEYAKLVNQHFWELINNGSVLD